MNLGMQVNKIKILRMEHKKGRGAKLLSFVAPPGYNKPVGEAPTGFWL